MIPDTAVIHADGSITIDDITYYSIDDYFDSADDE